MSASGFIPFETLAVVGLGLIGGSFSKDVRRLGLSKNILGYDNNSDNWEKIRSLNLVDYLAKNPNEKLKEAELILLAVPVKAYRKILSQIRPYINKSVIITDVGSVKTPLCRIMSSKDYKKFNFVGGHPIAGSEDFGPNSARDKLFAGKRFILTPNKNSIKDTVQRIRSLWESMGANITEMDPETHDKMFASVSHLPHLLAYASISAITNSETQNALEYCGAGLKDFSRIASSNPEMWSNIFFENQKNLLSRIAIFKEVLNELEDSIRGKNEKKLIKILSQAKKERDRWMN